MGWDSHDVADEYKAFTIFESLLKHGPLSFMDILSPSFLYTRFDRWSSETLVLVPGILEGRTLNWWEISQTGNTES